jgi:N-methylhydantoinase B/oxoprolinase/acetone carboxylase alpha subunit
MKKIGLLLTAILFAVMFVNAQPGGGMMDPAERAKRTVEQLKTTLSLNADQVTKVEAVVKKYGEKQSQMFQEMGQGGDRDAMREKMTKMREDQTKEIKTLLTPDQVKKYDTYLKEQEARRAQGGFGGPGGGGGNR